MSKTRINVVKSIGLVISVLVSFKWFLQFSLKSLGLTMLLPGVTGISVFILYMSKTFLLSSRSDTKDISLKELCCSAMKRSLLACLVATFISSVVTHFNFSLNIKHICDLLVIFYYAFITFDPEYHTSGFVSIFLPKEELETKAKHKVKVGVKAPSYSMNNSEDSSSSNKPSSSSNKPFFLDKNSPFYSKPSNKAVNIPRSVPAEGYVSPDNQPREIPRIVPAEDYVSSAKVCPANDIAHSANGSAGGVEKALYAANKSIGGCADKLEVMKKEYGVKTSVEKGTSRIGVTAPWNSKVSDTQLEQLKRQVEANDRAYREQWKLFDRIIDEQTAITTYIKKNLTEYAKEHEKMTDRYEGQWDEEED